MSSFELTFGYLPATRNKVTGRFMKGHVPPNKGKKWHEYMSEEMQQKVLLTATSNLNKYRPHHRPDVRERLKKGVIAVFEDGSWKHFETISDAAIFAQCDRAAIRRAAKQNHAPNMRTKIGRAQDYSYKGARWYYETDDIWTKKIRQ